MLAEIHPIDAPADLPPLRWCGWCAHPTRYGRHFADGRFDFDSVVVTDAEVVKGRAAANRNIRPAEQVRRNIALGYHSGARP
jgi:hypothetical protein